MNFKAEKSNMGTGLIIASVLTNIIILLLFILTGKPIYRALLIMIFLIINMAFFYFTALSFTLNYNISEDELRVNGAFGLLDKRIPMKYIKSFRRIITLPQLKGLKGFKGKRFALGKSTGEDGIRKEYYITDTRKTVLVDTGDKVTAVSPVEEDEFCERLKSYGVTEEEKNTEHIMDTEDETENDSYRLKEIVRYTVIITLIFTLIPIIPDSFGIMPDYVVSGAFPDSGIIMTSSAYIGSTLFNAAVMVGVLLLFYTAAITVFKNDGKYHYRIMFFPLILSVVFLFREISTVFLTLAG